MTRRSDAIARIEAIGERAESALKRIEEALDPATPGGMASVTAEAKAARSASEAALASTQTSADQARSLAAGLRASLGAVESAVKTMAGEMARQAQSVVIPDTATIGHGLVVTPMTPAARPAPAGSAGTSGKSAAAKGAA